MSSANPFADHIPRTIPEADNDSCSSSEYESDTSVHATLGSTPSPQGHLINSLSGLSITPRSMSGYRIGYDRTYNTLYVKACQTKDNITVDTAEEKLPYPPTDESFKACMEVLRTVIHDCVPVLRRVENIAWEQGSKAARQSISDQETRKIKSIIIQSLVLLSYVPS